MLLKLRLYFIISTCIFDILFLQDSETSTVIEVISIVGCSVSILCLLITLLTHLLVWR